MNKRRRRFLADFGASEIVREPPAVTACGSSRVLRGSTTLSLRSIHRHPFHLPIIKGSQITRGPPCLEARDLGWHLDDIIAKPHLPQTQAWGQISKKNWSNGEGLFLARLALPRRPNKCATHQGAREPTLCPSLRTIPSSCCHTSMPFLHVLISLAQ